jgi:pimeloyl-ACP methyl ester carboxylesterase
MHDAPRSRTGLVAAAALSGLALLAADTARRVYRAERDHPPEGRFVDLPDGTRLHLVESGQGRPVVLLHGAGLTLDDFLSGPMRRLALRFHVVAVDRPGLGYSTPLPQREASPQAQARAIHQAVRALGLRRPVLVGHSLGATVALAYAELFPHDIAGVVAIAPAITPEPALLALSLGIPGWRGLGTLLDWTVLPPVARMMLPAALRRLFWPQRPPASFRRALPTGLLLRPSQIAAAAREVEALGPALARLADCMPTLEVPVEIIAGSEDQILDPVLHAARLARELPRARLVLLRETGHMPHHVAMGAVVNAVERVLLRAATPPVPAAGAGRVMA